MVTPIPKYRISLPQSANPSRRRHAPGRPSRLQEDSSRKERYGIWGPKSIRRNTGLTHHNSCTSRCSSHSCNVQKKKPRALLSLKATNHNQIYNLNTTKISCFTDHKQVYKTITQGLTINTHRSTTDQQYRQNTATPWSTTHENLNRIYTQIWKSGT